MQSIGVEALTQSVCDLALGFGEGKKEGEKRMSRPFGVALLLAGFDRREGPQLFFSDPSGTYFQFKAKAIGAGSEGAQATLQDKYRADLTLRDAEDLVLEILKQVMEEKLSNVNVEVASVTSHVRHIPTSPPCLIAIRHSPHRASTCIPPKSWTAPFEGSRAAMTEGDSHLHFRSTVDAMV